MTATVTYAATERKPNPSLFIKGGTTKEGKKSLDTE
jgi:hypothetical protein